MKIRILLVAMLAVVMLALGTGTALAEGHMCRHWYPSAVYGGYWLWVDCPQDAGDGRWGDWYPDLPWYEWNSPYLEIGEPVNF